MICNEIFRYLAWNPLWELRPLCSLRWGTSCGRKSQGQCWNTGLPLWNTHLLHIIYGTGCWIMLKEENNLKSRRGFFKAKSYHARYLTIYKFWFHKQKTFFCHLSIWFEQVCNHADCLFGTVRSLKAQPVFFRWQHRRFLFSRVIYPCIWISSFVTDEGLCQVHRVQPEEQ